MELIVKGIPEEFWNELRPAISREAEQFLRDPDLPQQKVLVCFVPPIQGEIRPLHIIVVQPPLGQCQLRFAQIVAGVCAEHTKQNGWWYRGYYIAHLLSTTCR